MSNPVDQSAPIEVIKDEDTCQNQEAQKKGKKVTSAVWNEFRRETEKREKDGKEVIVTIATCRYCKRKFDGDSLKSTTHLRNHLKACTKKLREDIRQKLIQASNKKYGTCALSIWEYDETVSQKELARMILLYEYPFSIVEYVGFQRFIHSLKLSFQVKCRNTMKKACDDVYMKEKRKLYNLFVGLSSRVSLTMDKWTSCQNKSYLYLMAHYVDDEWKLQKKIINFVKVEGKGIRDKLYECFMTLVINWNIDGKLFSLAVDNDSANDFAIRIMKEHLSKSLIMGGEFFHVRCAAHIINLVVQAGLKKIENAIKKVLESVKFV